MRIRILSVAATLILAGCASGPQSVFGPSRTTELGRYETIEGRGPEVVAELRAAPAPTDPLLVDGTNFAADQRKLSAQGFLQIGTAHFPANAADAREDALHQGRNVGADQVIVYPPAASASSAASANELTAAYFVRFKLPFGATFRDLNATEKQAMKARGVRIGSVVNGTPASKANLLAGDIIVSLDGKPVANRGEFQSMLRANAGHAVTLGVVRNGETLNRMVRLGLTPGAAAASATSR
ncbi:MAG: PDZ domain-containing protein [Rhodanobacteraceae bacterium]